MIEKDKLWKTMSLVNANQDRCKELWTRDHGKEKLVIDYVMINKECLSSIKVMIINETKGYATNRLEQQNQGLKETCSDHNVIFLISIQKPFKQKNGKQLTTTE